MTNNLIKNTEFKVIGITHKCAYCNSYMINDGEGSYYCEKQCEGVKEEIRLLDEAIKAYNKYLDHKLKVIK